MELVVVRRKLCERDVCFAQLVVEREEVAIKDAQVHLARRRVGAVEGVAEGELPRGVQSVGDDLRTVLGLALIGSVPRRSRRADSHDDVRVRLLREQPVGVVQTAGAAHEDRHVVGGHRGGHSRAPWGYRDIGRCCLARGLLGGRRLAGRGRLLRGGRAAAHLVRWERRAIKNLR